MNGSDFNLVYLFVKTYVNMMMFTFFVHCKYVHRGLKCLYLRIFACQTINKLIPLTLQPYIYAENVARFKHDVSNTTVQQANFVVNQENELIVGYNQNNQVWGHCSPIGAQNF